MTSHEADPFLIGTKGTVQILTPEAAELARCALPTFELPATTDMFTRKKRSDLTAYPLDLTASQSAHIIAFSRDIGPESELTPTIEILAAAVVKAAEAIILT